jgi:peptidoglycan/LPS O-acetylase OafA/YrhL
MQSKDALTWNRRYEGFVDATAGFDGPAQESGRNPRSASETRATAIGTTGPKQLGALTSVRALFALMVLYHHFVGYHRLAMPDWAADAGNIAVSWFFILSGFILAYNFPVLRGGEEAFKFIVSRFWRLFPVHAVMILVSVVLFSGSGLGLIRAHPAALLVSLTLTHAWPAIPAASQVFNVPAWSISVEWFFYLLFPLLIAQGWVVRILLAVAAFAIAGTWAHALGCFASQANFQAPGDSYHTTCYQLFLYWPPARLWEFMLGMAICSLSSRIRALRGCEFIQVMLTALAIWAFLDRANLIGPISFSFHWSFFGSWIITSLIGAALILALSLPGPIDRALSFPALVFLGEVSFSVYMTHMLVLRFADTHQIGYTQPVTVQLAVTYAVVTAISACLFLYVEKPSRLMLKRAFAASPDDARLSSGIAPIPWLALLQLQPLEDRLRNQADDQHHQEPDRPHVDHVLAPINSGEHSLADLLGGRGDRRRQLHLFRHPGPDKARLDGHDMNAIPCQPISQAGEKGGESSLGGAVDIVGAAPAVAGHRRDSDKGPMSPRAESLGEAGEDQRRTFVV